MKASWPNTPQPNPDQGSLELTEEYIRLRAYQLYERRGREHGHDVEDWLAAEAEVMGKKNASTAEKQLGTARHASAA